MLVNYRGVRGTLRAAEFGTPTPAHYPRSGQNIGAELGQEKNRSRFSEGEIRGKFGPEVG